MDNSRLCKYIDELLLYGSGNDYLTIFNEDSDILYSGIINDIDLENTENFFISQIYTQFDEIDEKYEDGDSDYILVVYTN